MSASLRFMRKLCCDLCWVGSGRFIHIRQGRLSGTAALQRQFLCSVLFSCGFAQWANTLRRPIAQNHNKTKYIAKICMHIQHCVVCVSKFREYAKQ